MTPSIIPHAVIGCVLFFSLSVYALNMNWSNTLGAALLERRSLKSDTYNRNLDAHLNPGISHNTLISKNINPIVVHRRRSNRAAPKHFSGMLLQVAIY